MHLYRLTHTYDIYFCFFISYGQSNVNLCSNRIEVLRNLTDIDSNMRLSNSEINRESNVNVRSACNAHLDSTRRMCDAPSIYGPRKQVHSLDFIIIERWLRDKACYPASRDLGRKRWVMLKKIDEPSADRIRRRFLFLSITDLRLRPDFRSCIECDVNEPRTRLCAYVYVCAMYIWEWAVKVLPDQPIGTRSRIGEIELILCICSRVACAPICVMESRERNVLCVGVDFQRILGRLYHESLH